MNDLEQSMTATERIVAAIWAGELSLPSVEPQQDFFDLGGDSMKMLNMLFHVSRTLSVDIPPGALFEESTLRGLCRRIDSAAADASGIDNRLDAHTVEGSI